MDEDEDERAVVDEDAYDVSSVRKVQKQEAITMPLVPVLRESSGPLPSWAEKYQKSKAKVERIKGSCVKWNSKGFGFIRPDGASDRSSDIYVHQRELHKEGFRSLLEGEWVEFQIALMDDGRPHAVQVTGPGGVEVQGQKRPQDSDNEDDDSPAAEGKADEKPKAAASKAHLAFLPRAIKKPVPKTKPKAAAAVVSGAVPPGRAASSTQ